MIYIVEWHVTAAATATVFTAPELADALTSDETRVNVLRVVKWCELDNGTWEAE